MNKLDQMWIGPRCRSIANRGVSAQDYDGDDVFLGSFTDEPQKMHIIAFTPYAVIMCAQRESCFMLLSYLFYLIKPGVLYNGTGHFGFLIAKT